jgi:adenosylcobinamide hydrolase
MQKVSRVKLQTSIDFVKADVDKHKLLISSEKPLVILSSAVHNGGFKKAKTIISIHVPEHSEENCNRKMDDLDKELHENPELILQRAIKWLGISLDDAVGIMTNADVRNVDVSHKKCGDITLSVFVTAGVEVAARAGELTISLPNQPKIDIGTINVVVLIDGNLTESCMVDAIKTITEAKTMALKELDVRSCFSGDLASGTVTDSVVVACTKRGKPISYAGTATVIGELIGKSVKQSLKKTLYNEQKVEAGRCLIKRLKERRISLEKITNIFLIAHPRLSQKAEQFKKQVDAALSNPEIVPIVVACLRLDEDIKNGLVPKNMFDKPATVEVLQAAVAKCLCNKKIDVVKVVEATSLDNEESLGPFTEKILATIMTCVSSSLL